MVLRRPGLPQLPGEPALAVYTDRPPLFQKLWAIPGVRRWQTGALEIRAVFPPEALELVAGVIRARRRATRVMTPARLAGLAAAREKLRAACPRATSRLQDRAEAGTLDLETFAGPEAGAMTEITLIGGVRRKEPLMLLERAWANPERTLPERFQQPHPLRRAAHGDPRPRRAERCRNEPPLMGYDPTTMALTRLFSVPEAAQALNVTEAAIRRWIFERRLTVVEVGSAVRIEEAELARLIEAGRQPRWPSLRASRPPASEGVVPSRPKLPQLGALPELVDETVETPIDVDAVHELIAQLLLQAHRAHTA